MAELNSNWNLHQKFIIHHLLTSGRYDTLAQYLGQQTSSMSENTRILLELGQAIRIGNVERVNQLIHHLPNNFLHRQTRIEQRARFLFANMTIQKESDELGHYFRALTPLMVDLLRLLIERHILPQLNEFLIPEVKDTENGNFIYRGLRWNKSRIEQSNNIIHQTWDHYYKDSFNYNHYVSSSHLVKIIRDHGQNNTMIRQIEELRTYEKLLRNLTAHEIVFVNADFISRRANTTIDHIHTLLTDLLIQSKIESHKEQTLLSQLNQKIIKTLNE